jgi:outer membrane protein TolC
MLGFGLAGCTVGPDYQSPEIAAASRRTSLETVDVPSRTIEGKIDSTWWKSFRDSQLSSLVERLVAQNLDLKTAAERVVQSVAQRQVAVSQGLPHIEGQSSSSYNRQSPNGTLSLLTPAPGAPLEYALFRDGLTSSWRSLSQTQSD